MCLENNDGVWRISRAVVGALASLSRFVSHRARQKKVETHLPPGIVLHNLLLPRQGGLLAPVRIPVLLGKKKRDDVDP